MKINKRNFVLGELCTQVNINVAIMLRAQLHAEMAAVTSLMIHIHAGYHARLYDAKRERFK